MPTSLSPERKQVVTYLLATQRAALTSYSRTAGLWRLLPLLCPELGVPLNPLLLTSARLPWTWLSFLRAAHGEDLVVALCNMQSINQRLSTVRLHFEENNSTAEVEFAVKSFIELQLFQEQVSNTTSKASEVLSGTPEKQQQNVTDLDILSPSVKERAKTVEKPQVTQKENSEDVIEEQVQITPPLSPQSNGVVQQQQQTTWQKLSARIKALEWNVTMSTGFLEELSLKYIQQTEELNTAVKAANEAIAGVVKREETLKETLEERDKQVVRLVAEVEEMRELVEKSREEVVTRHALLLLLEGCVLGLLLVCCRNGRGRDRETGGRRVSLDLPTVGTQQQGSRRQSYEPPPAAALVDEEQHLSKRQKKRKRRRESANLLK